MEYPPFSIENTSSIRVHVPASYVRLPECTPMKILVKSSTQIRAGWDRGYVSFVEGIPWKIVVGRWTFPFNIAPFQGTFGHFGVVQYQNQRSFFKNVCKVNVKRFFCFRLLSFNGMNQEEMLNAFFVWMLPSQQRPTAAAVAVVDHVHVALCLVGHVGICHSTDDEGLSLGRPNMAATHTGSTAVS